MLIKEIVDYVHGPTGAGVPLKIKLVVELSAFMAYALFVRWWSWLFLRALAYDGEFLSYTGRWEKENVLERQACAKKEGQVEVMEKPYTEITNREKVSNTDPVLFYRLVCDN